MMNQYTWMNAKLVEEALTESIKVKEAIVSDKELCDAVVEASKCIAYSIKNGGKILVCGNGGSASDALHFCGEIVGRFQKDRKAAPAIPLNADVAAMTAIANDYGYDRIFERGVQAFMKSEDVLVGISTSGNSKNVWNAMLAAKEVGGRTVALIGKSGGVIKSEADISLLVPSNVTARIQESHICIIHIICDLVEQTLE